MKSIHSSWNENRVASCCVRKVRERKDRDPHKGWFTEFVGTTVSVRTPRGRVVFTRTLDAAVSSATISDGMHVNVETVSGATYVLDLDSGSILEACPASEVVQTAFVASVPADAAA